MANYAIKATNLRVVRGGAEILHGLNFEIEPCRITGLLGPSGCGKTTLIRSIAGTQVITDGAVSVLGRPAGSSSLRTEVSYAAQSAAVYSDLSVVENIRYFAAVLRAPASDVDRVIDSVDLAQHRDRLVGRMSGGERSRVSLAIALLGNPRLLLLDEPTVGLDPVLREQLWQLFDKIAKDGLSVLISSHVMDEAARCDELLLMRAGDLLAECSPDELRQRTGREDLGEAFMQLIREIQPDRSAA